MRRRSARRMCARACAPAMERCSRRSPSAPPAGRSATRCSRAAAAPSTPSARWRSTAGRARSACNCASSTSPPTIRSGGCSLPPPVGGRACPGLDPGSARAARRVGGDTAKTSNGRALTPPHPDAVLRTASTLPLQGRVSAPTPHRTGNLRSSPPRVFYGWYVVLAVALVLTTSSGLGFYNLSVLLDAFVRERGLSVALVSGATACHFIGLSTGGVLAGWLIDRIDPRKVVIASAALSAPSRPNKGTLPSS